jgi:hypothetical protein
MFYEFEGNEYYAMVFVPKGFSEDLAETALIVYYDDVCNEEYLNLKSFLNSGDVIAVEITEQKAFEKYQKAKSDDCTEMNFQNFKDIKNRNEPCCVLVDCLLL